MELYSPNLPSLLLIDPAYNYIFSTQKEGIVICSANYEILTEPVDF